MLFSGSTSILTIPPHFTNTRPNFRLHFRNFFCIRPLPTSPMLSGSKSKIKTVFRFQFFHFIGCSVRTPQKKSIRKKTDKYSQRMLSSLRRRRPLRPIITPCRKFDLPELYVYVTSTKPISALP